MNTTNGDSAIRQGLVMRSGGWLGWDGNDGFTGRVMTRPYQGHFRPQPPTIARPTDFGRDLLLLGAAGYGSLLGEDLVDEAHGD